MRPFRARALGAGAVAGVLARRPGSSCCTTTRSALYHGLVAGDGLPALIVSVARRRWRRCALVVRGRFEPARYTAALAVAAIVAGWALAQPPSFLPGLTVEQAAAPHDTLVAVIVAVAGRRARSSSRRSALLFRLTLGGRLGHGATSRRAGAGTPRELVRRAARPGCSAAWPRRCLVAGFGLLTVAEAGWAHAFGVVALLGFIVARLRRRGARPARGRAGRRLGRALHRERHAHRGERVLEAGAGLRCLPA